MNKNPASPSPSPADASSDAPRPFFSRFLRVRTNVQAGVFDRIAAVARRAAGGACLNACADTCDTRCGGDDYC